MVDVHATGSGRAIRELPAMERPRERLGLRGELALHRALTGAARSG